jgi:hypothetical protein
MVNDNKFNTINIRVKKIKSPKVNRNPLFKSFKKEFTKTVQQLDHKKIKLKSKRKKNTNKNTILDIPTNLSIKPVVPNKSPNKSPSKLPSKSPIKDKKIMKKTKKLKHPKKYKTISVKFKKNNKEKEINKLLNEFNKMDLKNIQSKLKSKGIDVKKTNKNKLLKYIYLLTCVDDNINVIKG